MNDGNENWVNEIFECEEYTDAITGSKRYNSEFTLSCCLPCLIIGRTHSILQNEVYFDSNNNNNNNSILSILKLGNEGCLICFFLSICNCFLPLSFTPFIFCFTFYQRIYIMNQFNIEGNFFEYMKSCFCPCAIFQQYRFIKDIQNRKLDHCSASSMKKTIITKQLTNNNDNDDNSVGISHK